jgi:cysteine desulfurase/selenocysteine lyase
MATPTTRLKVFAFTHLSNTLGTINPVALLCARARAVGAISVIDAAQSIGHGPFDVRAIGADFVAFSGHKMCGPTGIGVLYGREALLCEMPPWQGGGDMILAVSFEKSVYNSLPWKFEAGTPHIAGAIGLGAAIDYLRALGMQRIAATEQDLLEYSTARLQAIPGLRLVGTAAHKAAVVSFVIDGIHPHDLGTILDHEGVAIRTGHHCAMPVMDFFKVPATARASFSFYNTHDEVDRLVAALDVAREMLG